MGSRAQRDRPVPPGRHVALVPAARRGAGPRNAGAARGLRGRLLPREPCVRCGHRDDGARDPAPAGVGERPRVGGRRAGSAIAPPRAVLCAGAAGTPSPVATPICWTPGSVAPTTFAPDPPTVLAPAPTRLPSPRHPAQLLPRTRSAVQPRLRSRAAHRSSVAPAPTRPWPSARPAPVRAPAPSRGGRRVGPCAGRLVSGAHAAPPAPQQTMRPPTRGRSRRRPSVEAESRAAAQAGVPLHGRRGGPRVRRPG